MATCEHTSVNNVALRSLIILCQIEGYPPLGQGKACSTEKGVPQAQCIGVRTNHNAGQGNIVRQIYAAQNHFHQG